MQRADIFIHINRQLNLLLVVACSHESPEGFNAIRSREIEFVGQFVSVGLDIEVPELIQFTKAISNLIGEIVVESVPLP
ncbi:MAG: hypothetical protein GY794_14135 [bacterium]|nr:hypothetical protein [bacterium]